MGSASNDGALLQSHAITLEQLPPELATIRISHAGKMFFVAHIPHMNVSCPVDQKTFC
jgi:hypothetical protein